MGSPSHHSVSKEELPDQPVIIDMPKDLEPDPNNTCWIFRVPEKLRNVKEATYTLHLVCIGPLHHGNPKLNAMEHQKFKNYENRSDDYILRTPWQKTGIKLDLIMLNQLPYFVFNELFDFMYPEDENGTESKNNHQLSGLTGESKCSDCFKNISCEFFLDYHRFGKPLAERTYMQMTQSTNKIRFADLVKNEKDGEIKIPFKGIKYFTDLVRKFMLPGDQYPEKDDAIFCLCTATQLSRAGVKFVRCKENRVIADTNKKTEPYPMFKGVYRNYLKLEIPELKIKGNTECIMRNVMALEQFAYPDEPFICNYVFLLGQLISTAEDVEFMIDKKIAHNWLGSNEEVVRMVNKLRDQIVVSRYFYAGLCQIPNQYYDNPWNFFKATLMRVYFKDLFTICSTIIGIVFLVFSFFSTYSTIKSLFF
ncbi:uncharacterized protein LOC132804387 [Ziziphus jujuba]|uniref:Uncharacterized protein LOC132804387 n=1 Tax=Ziziphus jujuba TaxID=326968 RepID=A0ABM4AD59_ZIZJJ|nr:uncharacterized protein LOC132804387 [Ziziphus jujuba]